VFVATFASTILTFFIGALLFDYQLERTEARRGDQLRTLLVAELDGISEGLDRANAAKVRVSDGSAAEVMIAHLQPTLIDEALRDGLFCPVWTEKALRLARNTRTYNAKISYFLSNLSFGRSHEPGSTELRIHAIDEIEVTRQRIVADARKLSGFG